MITWLAIYALVKFWLPVITAFGLVIKGFHLASVGVSNWADRLLNNHLSHIEDSNERAATAISELASYHKESLSLQQAVIHEIQEQRADIRSLTAKL